MPIAPFNFNGAKTGQVVVAAPAAGRLRVRNVVVTADAAMTLTIKGVRTGYPADATTGDVVLRAGAAAAVVVPGGSEHDMTLPDLTALTVDTTGTGNVSGYFDYSVIGN